MMHSFCLSQQTQTYYIVLQKILGIFFNLQKCHTQKFQIQKVFTLPSLHNPCMGHPVAIVHFV